ncbi:DUF1254 domain-containing protein [Maricaulis parjimensis]|uniref:DUF1254 domain-containing protein n=1 Tax=Maricaulis parjimensis TaxID=144023 RepID=UPI00193AAAD3|nr:DUF1254 domain-containing protein [Maricaulis parjimensis]
MMRLLVPLGLFLASFLAAGLFTLNAVPAVIMGKAMERIEAAGAASGGVRHAPRLREDNQTIVRASPDILYSVCAYDLSEGDLELSIPWPADGNYASISFYDARTNNFAVISDREAEGEAMHLILSSDPNASALHAPTERGLALYRRVINAETDLEAADADRRGFTCTSLSDQ